MVHGGNIVITYIFVETSESDFVVPLAIQRYRAQFECNKHAYQVLEGAS